MSKYLDASPKSRSGGKDSSGEKDKDRESSKVMRCSLSASL